MPFSPCSPYAKNGAGNVTSDAYDDDLLTTEVVTNGTTTVRYSTYEYDDNDNVTLTTNGNGTDSGTTVTSDVYDGQNLVTEVVEHGTTILSYNAYQYDKDGNVTLTTDGDSNVTSDTFAGNQLTSEQVTHGTTTLSYESYLYDSAGNLTETISGLSGQNQVVSSDTYLGNLLVSAITEDGTGGSANTQSSMTYAYDEAGNQTWAKDGDGNITSDTYDDNLLTTEVVTNGTTTVRYSTYEYDDNDNVTLTTNGDGTDSGTTVTSDVYDGQNLVTEVVTSGTATLSYYAYQYDDDGNVVATTDAYGNVTSDTYAGNQLTSEQVTHGTTTLSYESYLYDSAGNLTETIAGLSGQNQVVSSDTYLGNLLAIAVTKDGSGNVQSSMTYQYDDDGNQTWAKDGDNNVTSDTYDDNLLTTEVVTNGGTISSMTYEYDDNDNVALTTDGDGNKTSDVYDGQNLVTELVETSGGTTLSYYAYAYDQDGNVTATTDAYGNITSDTYAGNQLTSELVKQGTTTLSYESYLYDSAGNLTETISGLSGQNQVVSSDTYLGNLLVSAITEDGTGGSANTQSSLTYAYDEAGNQTWAKDGDNNVTSDAYDDDLLTTEVVTNGTTISSMTYQYDDNGNITLTTDGDGNKTSDVYDGQNLVTELVETSGGTTLSYYAYQYDKAGNVTLTTDFYGNKTSDTYAGNQLTSEVVKDDSGNTISSASYAYDSAGNVTSVTDGASTTLSYYRGNEVTMTVTGSGASAATTTYGYDKNGNQTSVVDPDGNTTLYTYDANGNVLTVANASGTTTNAYNDNGQLTSTVDPDGRTISYQYDGMNLTTETWYSSSGSVTNVETFTYDEDGNTLTAGSTTGGSYTMTYVGNEMQTQITPTGDTFTYGYDKDGDVTLIQDNYGTTSMTYDALGDVLTKNTTASGVTLGVTSTYDDDGDLLSEARYDDGTFAGATTYGYDDGNVTSIYQTDPSGTMLGSFSYTYNSDGQVTQEIDNGTTTKAYEYNSVGELTEAVTTTSSGTTTATYSYDANGNPTGTGITLGPDNELLTDGVYSYTYDSAGNLVQQVSLDGALTWSYSYNNANELTSAVETTSGSPLASATYSYDVFGNRTGESYSSTYIGSSSEDSIYTMAGTSGSTLYADINPSDSSLQELYVSGVNGPDTWLARIDSSGGAWLLSDNQGSVTTVVGASGSASAVLDVNTYDAFGSVTQSNPSEAGYFGFQGGLTDPITGNVYFVARSYDPQTQRWTTQDPDGLTYDMNPYRFVNNAPTNGTDPTGQYIVTPNHSSAALWVKKLESYGIGVHPKMFNDGKWWLQVLPNQAANVKKFDYFHDSWWDSQTQQYIISSTQFAEGAAGEWGYAIKFPYQLTSGEMNNFIDDTPSRLREQEIQEEMDYAMAQHVAEFQGVKLPSYPIYKLNLQRLQEERYRDPRLDALALLKAVQPAAFDWFQKSGIKLRLSDSSTLPLLQDVNLNTEGVGGSTVKVLDVKQNANPRDVAFQIYRYILAEPGYRKDWESKNPTIQVSGVNDAVSAYGQMAAASKDVEEKIELRQKQMAAEFGTTPPFNWIKFGNMLLGGQSDNGGYIWTLLDMVGGIKGIPNLQKQAIESQLANARPSQYPTTSSVLASVPQPGEPGFMGPVRPPQPGEAAFVGPIAPQTPTTPRPARMQVEPVEISTGTGRDFVIPGRSVPERFSARLMNGSDTLEVAWTDSLRQTPGRLQQVQELAGGPGSFRRITGRASADLEAAIRTGQLDAQQVAQQLGNSLGGRWRVDVARIPGTEPPQFNITAVRIGD